MVNVHSGRLQERKSSHDETSWGLMMAAGGMVMRVLSGMEGGKGEGEGSSPGVDIGLEVPFSRQGEGGEGGGGGGAAGGERAVVQVEKDFPPPGGGRFPVPHAADAD
jgi:hypothetical protein